MAGKIPNWIEKPGLEQAIRAAGFRHWGRADEEWADDPAAVQAIIDSYDPLAFLKAQKQAALDTLLDDRGDMRKFIRSGTVTNVTGTQVGNFLASVNNRYRTLRTQIAAAATVVALNAIDITTGWPSNP